MAGTPFKNERLALIDANREKVLEWYEQGESMRRIAVRLTDLLEEPISEALVGRWAQQPENEGQVSRARAQAADHKAENVLDRAETLARDVKLGIADRDDIAAERHVAEQQRWIAGIWNRKYAPQTAASVQVNVGVIHLDSLRQASGVAPERPRELLEFEDVESVEQPRLSLSDLL